MRQNTAENRSYFDSASEAMFNEAASSPAENFSYASALRTLGHALEKYRFSAFSLTVEDDSYVITGTTPVVETPKPSFFQTVCNLLNKPSASTSLRSKTNELELRYSNREILELDNYERTQRRETPERPDPHSISQLLRGVGCYLDKRADNKLVSVAIKDRWVILLCRGRDGQLQKTQEDIEYFYNLWVKMYMQRSSRPAVPMMSAPTIW